MAEFLKGIQIVQGLYSQFLGNDTVTVAKGIFSSKIRADIMCKNHKDLKPIYKEVKSYYDECWENSRKEHKKSVPLLLNLAHLQAEYDPNL